MAKVFISYSRKDIEFAKKLTDELQKSDLDFWIDWEGIPPTVDWWKEIEKGIEEADIFIFLISPDSATSKICRQEIEHAVKNGKRLIPLIVREINRDENPPQLSHLNWIFFQTADNFDASLDALKTAIHTDYEWVQTHRRLQVRALEWDRNHHEDSFLLRGKDLQEAEAQLTVNNEKSPRPTDLQREYIARSSQIYTEELERQRLREQQIELEQKLGLRMRRLTYVLLGVFTVTFIVLFLWLGTIIRELAVQSVQDQMLAIAETSVSFVDGDQYETLVNSYEENDEAVLADPYYQWIASIVDNVVTANDNIDNDGDVGVYFVSQADEEDQVLAVYSDWDHFKSVWTVESDSVLLAGMEETSTNTTPYDDDFGTWVSACTPIHNSEDISVGALCVDLDASLVAEATQNAGNTLLFAFLAVYPAMLAAVILTTRSFSKQRIQLSSKTAK
jgi:hypothetical protein